LSKNLIHDFSYFIEDPDNDRSELNIYITSVSAAYDERWIENDPDNNMRLIFKFPFEAAEKTHSYALYAADPTGQQAYRIFNITVVIGNWPVEQIKSIPNQSFREDETKENAFKLDVNTEGSYYKDTDGGTNFEILEHEYINAVIDDENYVDLSSKVPDWNTGDGFTDLVVLAKDTYPEQYVYSIVNVRVIPVNDTDVKTNYYKIEIASVTGGSLSLSDAEFKCYTKEKVVLYEKTIFDANPTSITSGDTSGYPIPYSVDSVRENATIGDGTTIDAKSLTKPNVWEDCLFTYLDVQSNDKISTDDIIWVYLDYDDDGNNEIEPGYEFKIFDDRNKHIVTIELPADVDSLITIHLDLSDGGSEVIIEGKDSDSDGLPDTWEMTYGLNPDDQNDALFDLDNDSLTNLEEYKKGTDPTNPDTDGDGYLDKFDAYPTNPNKYKKETGQDYTLIFILISLIVIILLIIISIKLIITRSKRLREGKTNAYSGNELLDEVRHKILHGKPLKELEYSQADIEDMLEKQFQRGQISEYNYNFIKSNLLNSAGPPPPSIQYRQKNDIIGYKKY